jgi:cytochrome c oxidase subunit I
MDELQPIHAPPRSFIRRYIFSTDHKTIAKQFLLAGLFFLLFGGSLAMLIRWQWAYPGQPLPGLGRAINPAEYNTFFTMHGLIMIFFAITPILIGCFGNLLIPLQIGARDMAFPTLNMFSLWTFLLSQGLILASFFTRLGSAGAGWTTYPPLSGVVGFPGLGQTLVVAAIFVTGASTLMGAVNYITTVLRFRAPGMNYMRMPAAVWSLFFTAILNLIFVPVLAAGALLLFFDRVMGTTFFAAAGAASGPGDPILFQHLFWIFGHPEVYILILPVWGMLTDMLSFFSRKPANLYRLSVYAMAAVTLLSAVVYGHHMYLTGMNPMLGKSFMLLTLLISAPATVLFLNWLKTIWQGSIRFTTPMLFALGTVFVFGMGGLTGIYLGDISLDIYLHDTLFVVGHFHLTMAAASFLGSIAAVYFWFPKMFGRQLSERLGKWHFWLSTVLIVIVFTGQLIAGWSGQPRRLYDPYQYTFTSHLLYINKLTSHAAWTLFAAQFIFIYNFFHALWFSKEQAKDNPWEVGTLEWSVSSPPPYHNFDEIPEVVRGPHEFSDPEVKRRLGRDWVGQAEVLPGLDPLQGKVKSEEKAAE